MHACTLREPVRGESGVCRLVNEIYIHHHQPQGCVKCEIRIGWISAKLLIIQWRECDLQGRRAALILPSSLVVSVLGLFVAPLAFPQAIFSNVPNVPNVVPMMPPSRLNTFSWLR